MSPSSPQPLPCSRPHPLLPGQEPPKYLPYSSLISHIPILHMDCNAVFLKFTSAHISPCLKTFDGYLAPKVHPNLLMWPTNYFTIWAQTPSPTSSHWDCLATLTFYAPAIPSWILFPEHIMSFHAFTHSIASIKFLAPTFLFLWQSWPHHSISSCHGLSTMMLSTALRVIGNYPFLHVTPILCTYLYFAIFIMYCH